MKVIKFILWTLLIIVGVLLIYSLVAPKSYTVDKSITIEAPHDLVYEQAVHWDNFQEWSTRSELDSDMEVEFQGNFGEVGSSYTWNGNDDAGSGKQEITSASDELVEIDLTFKEPFESEAKTSFMFDEQDEGIEVTWGMSGDMAWPMNVMTPFIKNSIGEDYEKGLEALKERCEAIAEKEIVDGYRIRMVELNEQKYIGKRGTIDWADFQSFNANTYRRLYPALAKAEIAPTGPATNFYFVWDEENQKTDMMVALPIDGSAEEIKGFDYFTVENGQALQTDYMGDYEGLGAAHEAIDKYIKANNVGAGNVAIEVYLTNPEEVENPDNWKTRIIYPIQ